MQLERVGKPSEASCDGNAGQGSISFSHRSAKSNLHRGVVLASAANKLQLALSQLTAIAAQRMTHWANGGAET